MRKKYFLGMALMASLAFNSCTKEVVIVQEGNGTEDVAVEDGQVLTLQVANSGNGLTTRAGRPLLSSQAKQDINTVILYVVNNSSKVVLEKTISASEWANALDYTNGKQLEISFKGSENQKLTGSSEGIEYTIYAVGYYETGANYKEIKISDAPTVTTDGSQVAFPTTGLYALLNNNANPAEEIFAGQVSVKVVTKNDGTSYIIAFGGDADKKVVPALVLNRQVAGVTGYFTNIPAKVGEQIPAKIRLIASNKSNKVHFTSLFLGETGDNAITDKKNVVNGSASSLTAENLPYWNSNNKGYKVYEIALSDFFTEMSGESSKKFNQLDYDGDGFVGYKDAQYYVYKMSEGLGGTSGGLITFDDLKTTTGEGGKTYLEATWSDAIQGNEVTVNGKKITANKLENFWKNKEAYKGKQTLVAGSVFAGEFIIPFLQVSGVNTFELQLLDKEDNILKNWNVQVPATVSDGSVSDDAVGSYSNDESKLVYNIYRNHLYSLGLKTNDIEDGGEPSDPEKPVDPKPEPDPDGGGTTDPEDKPEDLSKGQDLLINVNDNWEIIHDMVID